MGRTKLVGFINRTESIWRDVQKNLLGVTAKAAARLFRIVAWTLAILATRRAQRLSSRYADTGTIRPTDSSAELLTKSIVRTLETSLWIAAAGMLGYCSFVYANGRVHHAQQEDLYRSRQAQMTASLKNSLKASDDGRLLGFLDIPRIGVSSVVEEGTAPNILSRGVGHLPGTALPGERGNVGFAGHLDTYAGELSQLRSGDLLTFRSPKGRFDYTVVSADIVTAAPTKISGASQSPSLTLINYLPAGAVSKTAKQMVVIARETLVGGPHLCP